MTHKQALFPGGRRSVPQIWHQRFDDGQARLAAITVAGLGEGTLEVAVSVMQESEG